MHRCLFPRCPLANRRGVESAGTLPPLATSSHLGGYIGQFDSYRVIACCAVVLQHSLLWNVAAGNTTAWAFVMLLHFSRTAFFFLTAFLLTYSEITRPRPVKEFYRSRYVQIGVPFLVWTAIYWVFTMVVAGAWGQAGSLLWNDLVFGYYQLYFVVVLLQLYLVFPLLLRLIRSSTHHGAVMVGSLLFALLLAADLHYTQYFGVVGEATRAIASVWPWARDPITYQEQFIAGVLVALHYDEIRRFVELRWRQVVASPSWCAQWPRCGIWWPCGRARHGASLGPVPACGLLWFTAAVAALECGTWVWYRRRVRRAGQPRNGPRVFSAEYLAGLTGGIFFCHVLFLNLIRSGWRCRDRAASRMGRTGRGHLRADDGRAALCTALLLHTPLRWVMTGPIRNEQGLVSASSVTAETHGAPRRDSGSRVRPVLGLPFEAPARYAPCARLS